MAGPGGEQKWEAANQAKGAFLGSVSHDIRTPMNAIIGFTTLLKGETDNPAMVEEYAERIETASQQEKIGNAEL